MATSDDGNKRAQTLGRISLTLCLLLFLVFVANVLLGKARLIFDLKGVPVFSDVVEYLLLMATALFFAIAALMKERTAREREENGSDPA